MRRLKILLVMALMAGLTLAGCSDDSPTGPDASEEYEAVINALTNSGALGFVGIYAGLAAPGELSFGEITVNEGTLAQALAKAAADAQASGWQALAIEVNLDFTDPEEGQIQESWTAVAAWTGLDVEMETVDQAVTAFALASALADNSADINTEEAFAYVIDNTVGAEGTMYFGDSGTFDVNSTSFGSTTPVEGSTGQTQYAITYAVGTISGGFNFTASDFADPPNTVTRSSTFSALPAIQINILDAAGR